MKRYKVVLRDFISAREIEDSFRELAKKEENIIIFDFHKVKTLDKYTFEMILKISNALKLLGKKVFFCCFPPSIAAIVSMWDYKFDVMFEDS